MGPTERGGNLCGRGWLLLVAMASLALACKSASPGGGSLSSQAGLGFQPPVTWAGVKVVQETLAPSAGADPSAPIAVAGGLGGIYVQWNSATTATISRFSTGGAEQAQNITYNAIGGRAGRALAVPICTNSGGHSQDCPLLAVDQSGPDVHVYPCLGSNFDFSPGSALGMIIGGGGSHAFQAERCLPNGAAQAALAVTPVRPGSASPCAYLYDEQSLYASSSDVYTDGYAKGRVVPLSGVPSGFTVGAAARLGPDGMVVAGTGGTIGPAWVVTLDASLVAIHQGSFPVGGGISAVVTSVVADSAGNVFVCGFSRSKVLSRSSLINAKRLLVSTHGWVAQGTPDLATWATLTLPLRVDGCALAPSSSGKLIVSGTYSGTYANVTSQGMDVFLALVTPGANGAAPTVASFVRHGSSDPEPVVSAPYLGFGSVFLAGVTLGNWGAALGVGQPKVFVARFDPATLALQ